MVFGRRKGPSGPDDNYLKQPPHIRRLIDAMQTIFDDASKLAEAIKRGAPLPASAPGAEMHLSPIRCAGSEKLFEHIGEKGEKLYTTYYFTSDFKTLDPSAQHGLYIMYTRIIFVNISINMPGNGSSTGAAALKSAIDEILAKSAYFVSFFRGYSRSTDLFMNKFDKQGMDRAMLEHFEDWTARMNAANDQATQPNWKSRRFDTTSPSANGIEK